MRSEQRKEKGEENPTGVRVSWGLEPGSFYIITRAVWPEPFRSLRGCTPACATKPPKAGFPGRVLPRARPIPNPRPAAGSAPSQRESIKYEEDKLDTVRVTEAPDLRNLEMCEQDDRRGGLSWGGRDVILSAAESVTLEDSLGRGGRLPVGSRRVPTGGWWAPGGWTTLRCLSLYAISYCTRFSRKH